MGFFEEGMHDLWQHFFMRPRSEFRHHAAIFFVDNLSADDVFIYLSIANDGSGGLIARGFYAENIHENYLGRFSFLRDFSLIYGDVSFCACVIFGSKPLVAVGFCRILRGLNIINPCFLGGATPLGGDFVRRV